MLRDIQPPLLLHSPPSLVPSMPVARMSGMSSTSRLVNRCLASAMELRRSRRQDVNARTTLTANSSSATPPTPPTPPTPTPTPTPPKASNSRARRRLDAACLELRPDLSKTVVQSFIVQGKVFVDGQRASKAGMQVKADAVITFKGAELPKYVCRAGFKLEKALDVFGLDVSGATALDSGLSTGGFTDCLLQNGARHVYGVDVGYAQVCDKIRTHSAVTVMERTNLRHLDTLPELVDVATLDLSFISLSKVAPAVVGLLRENADVVVLVKPQFEAGREEVGSGGVVRDPEVHRRVLGEVRTCFEELGLRHMGEAVSPLKGGQTRASQTGGGGGNTEFLQHYRRGAGYHK